MSTKSDTLRGLLPLVMQTGISIAILLIVWLVISLLPMLDAIDIPLKFTLSELIGAVILTVIIVLLVNFAIRLELRMSHLLADFPQGGTMAKLFVFMVAVLVGYSTYQPLVLPYIDNLEWVYHLLFFGVFAVILSVFGFTIYNNMEQLTALMTRSGRALSSTEGTTCPKCGEKNQGAGQFCSFCGMELPKLPQCVACGRILRPGVSFCPACGAAAGATAPGAAAAVALPAAPVCSSCSTQLKAGAKFCPSCGTAQE